VAKAYNKKVRPRVFEKKNLVLKKILIMSVKDRSKWARNHEELCVVKKAFFLVALILINMDDDDLPGPVNSNIVKKYFQSI
jgi:hypothetical protein